MKQHLDREAFQQRLDRITELFAGMVEHADELSQRRCPYKNRFDQCTALFGCRNQRPPRAPGEPKACAARDGDLDYRSAWEVMGEEEKARLREKLRK